VLTPTRELAAQVEESIRTYGKYLPLTSTVIFGGVGMNPQIDRIKKGVDILVATPGRLLDLQQQGHLDLSTVEILVLDEADRMLDMGFLPDVKKILALVPKDKQSLLFSATFSDEIRDLAHTLLRTRRASRSRRATPRCSASPRWCTRSAAARRRNCWRTSSRSTTGARCWCSRAPSSAPTASPNS
jgi:ATP-dependent RNA helicase RhlE